MLERSALWLVPWASSGQPDPGTAAEEVPLWAVFDAELREFLGRARRLSRGSAWFGLQPRPTVEVLETEDESLLFTLTRTGLLGLTWQIADADGHQVGTMRGNLARDALGRRLALLHHADGACLWLAPDGQPLGTVQPADGGLLAHFAADRINGNPFVKMILLATLLRV